MSTSAQIRTLACLILSVIRAQEFEDKRQSIYMVYSRRIIILIWLSFFVFGILEAILPTRANALSFIHAFILIVGAVFWCAYHAEENEIKIPRGSILLNVLIPIIGVPYYLLRGYGFKGGGLKLLRFFGFMIISVSLYFIPVELIEFLFR